MFRLPTNRTQCSGHPLAPSPNSKEPSAIVARLAVEGMTNRRVAQVLSISAKTAEVHLSRVYRKLGIRSRSQLPAAHAGEAPTRPDGAVR
jgi:DNA-binding NarL/FixJ family response regulator